MRFESNSILFLLGGSIADSIKTLVNQTTFQLRINTFQSNQIPTNTVVRLNNMMATCLVDVESRTANFRILRNNYGVETGTLLITPLVNKILEPSVVGDITTVSEPLKLTIRFKNSNPLQVNSKV